MTQQQTPAGWYPDPQDATQYRYWDGAAWTEHRSPRTTTTDQLNRAGQDLADGLSKGFTAFGSWVQQTAAPANPAQPTFASVAAACRDEPARHPLSRTVDLQLAPTDLDGIRRLYAATGTVITPDGTALENEVCRLVPNPWDPQNPTGVAVFVGAIQIGTLPADLAPEYSPQLTELTQKQLLATGTASLWAQGQGVPTAARVTIQIPKPSAFVG